MFWGDKHSQKLQYTFEVTAVGPGEELFSFSDKFF